MAVVIANQLRKEFAGDRSSTASRSRSSAATGLPRRPERRQDDPAPDARPGAAGWRVASPCSKGTRVALHDQRPPLEQGLTLREYVLWRRRPDRAGGGAASARAGHGRRRLRPGDAFALRRRAGRLEHAGGYAWRDRTAGVVRGLGFTDADLDRLLDTFSAASSRAPRWPVPWPETRISCSWTSRPTTWTSRASNGSSELSRSTPP